MTKTKTKSKKLQKKAVVDFDFGEADSVKAAMAKVLDVPEDDIEIEASHYEDFGTGYSFWKLEVGRKEYHVAESEETARTLALAVVLKDLRDSLENFNQDFIAGHIDKNHLRDELMSDVESARLDDLQEEAKRRPIEFMKEYDIDIPEPTSFEIKKYAEAMASDADEEKEILTKLKEGDAEDKWIEMGEEPEVPDSEIESVAEAQAKEQLKDPLAYLEDLYGAEDAIKRAIEIGGIDEEAAAEEAVDVDGAGHFLSTYDSSVHDGPGDLVYWRSN